MIKKLLIALVKWYQKRISPMTPPSCRYRRSCSNYMIVAIEAWAKGCHYGVARILRCHPFVEGGDDPVPDYFTLRRNKDYRKERGKLSFPLFVY